MRARSCYILIEKLTQSCLIGKRKMKKFLSFIKLSNSSFSMDNLENMCKSNIYVYPKPSRISSNSNRFNAFNTDHELNNGALYY